MPRFREKPSIRTRPPSAASKGNKKTKKADKLGLPNDRTRNSSKPGSKIESNSASTEKQREVNHEHPTKRREQADRSTLLHVDNTAPDAGAAWLVGYQTRSPLQQIYTRVGQDLVARADNAETPFIPGLMTASSSAASASSSHSSSNPTSSTSPTAARITNPIATIHHNTPLILCIVIGAIVITATLSVGLAWLLRLVCCAGERRARRKRRLDRSIRSPSEANLSKDPQDKAKGRSPFDSVTVKDDDDDLERKDAKIDALFGSSTSDGNMEGNVPVLGYRDVGKVPEAPKSTWNGKGWTLFDPPVPGLKQPQPVVTNFTSTLTGGGNYGAAKQELADQNVDGFTWPTSVERQPSFIERLVQRHHQASELPTTATPLPYPFEAKPAPPASRMASLGGAANRAVLNMLPVTLRNAATSASRQRATRKRYHDMQPYLDSDFEGTIGGKDRELPMARRLRRTEERMAVDWTTEEESSSPLNKVAQSGFPRVQAVLMPSPMIKSQDGGKVGVECTPGLAGVGAAWSRRGSQQSLVGGPRVSAFVKPSMATVQMPKVIEPNRVSVLPFPVMEGDRKSRLLGSVGRWLGQVSEAGEIADPYTALSPRPDRRLTKNGSIRSDYTSTTLADSASNSETHVEAQTDTSAQGRSERLLQRVDAHQAEHDRQQQRLLNKARLFTPIPAAAAGAPHQDEQDKDAQKEDAAVNVSRAPSIRPQFFATTDLKSWLEPYKVSTTHGFKVLEEQDAASSVAADPFASDFEAMPKLKKYDSYESITPVRPKLRSSSSKQSLCSSAVVGVKGTGRKKRDALRVATKKAGQSALPSACQSSATITVVSSVFDDAFAAQLNKAASGKDAAGKSGGKKQSRKSQSNNEAKAIAKAEADVAVRDAWRRRKMLSISSRGSQRTQIARIMTKQAGNVLLSRQESLRSQPSIYSELTAPSDYHFRAPLLSNSERDATPADCGAITIDTLSEDNEVAGEKIEMVQEDAEKKQEEEKKAKAKKQLKKEPKKQVKRQARRAEQERDEAAFTRSWPKQGALSTRTFVAPAQPQLKNRTASAASDLPNQQQHQQQQRRELVNSSSAFTKLDANAIAQQQRQMAVQRISRKQRSISLGMARNQYALMTRAGVDDVGIPDSPWTSSDSDISVRRWGEPRRHDSIRLQDSNIRHHHSNSIPIFMPEDVSVNKRAAAPKQARTSISNFYGMGPGGNLRDFC